MSWILLLILTHYVSGNSIILTGSNKESQRSEFLADLISLNLKTNGWSHILCVGVFPDTLYSKIKRLHHTFTIADIENDDYEMEHIVPYHSNVIIISCMDFKEFEDALIKTKNSPYWHPLSNIVLYYHRTTNQDGLAKIFFIFWFHKAPYAIIVQHDDSNELFQISFYNPYISENYKLQYSYGCWKITKLGRPISTFMESFICEQGCVNVTINSKLRAVNLGTCIGFTIYEVRYGDYETLRNLKLFEDISTDLHGFVLRAHGVEVQPFLQMKENSDGTFTPDSRDGTLWTVASELMNFVIDLSPSRDVIKETFNFETNIQLIYKFAQRQVDLLVFPIYQFDVVIVEIDLSVAYKDSGVCVLSHRAGFETILFDIKLLQENSTLVFEFAICFFCIWLLFFIYNGTERNSFTPDQAGKDFVNTIRNVLSISLFNPPKRDTFRIYFFISIWSFFIINFATQAAIISFFSAFKRGKEVETFDDIIEKGYLVEGMASPDMMLPETEEKFMKINSKLVPITDLFQCVNRMSNDSRRFCLIDCSVGRYLERNQLNENGQQYLHIANGDRFHSHYLVMIFHKYSPLTDTFNKYLRIFFEAGLIKKWEEYRFTDIKEEAPIKALGMDDLLGIFKCYGLFIGLSSAVFALEVIIGVLKFAKRFCSNKIAKWKRTRIAKKKLRIERKLGKVKLVNTSTQTIPVV